MISRAAQNISIAILVCLVAIMAAACDLSAQNAVTTPTLPEPRTATASRVSMGTPSIVIGPSRGKAGTIVTVVGSGFSPGSQVEVHLGGLNSGATTQVYGTTEAAQHGNIQVSFTMPERWPNGEAIVLPEVLVVAATPDFVEKATATFTYDAFGTPQATPTSDRQLDIYSHGSRLDCAASPDGCDAGQLSQPDPYY